MPHTPMIKQDPTRYNTVALPVVGKGAALLKLYRLRNRRWHEGR
jgi:hypothetical protein